MPTVSFPHDNSGYPFGLPQPALDLDFIETLNGLTINGAGGVIDDAGIYLVRFSVPKPLTVTTATILIGNTSAGNVDAGVYEDTAGDGSALSLVASSGSAAAGATGVQNLTLDPVANLMPGTIYYAALGVDDNSITFGQSDRQSPDIAAIFHRALFKISTFPLPDAITGATAAPYNPWIMLR